MLERHWSELLLTSVIGICLMTSVTHADDEDDSIAAALNQAKSAHTSAIAAAEMTFLDAVNAEQKRAAARGDLEETKSLLAEKAAFQTRTGPIIRPGLLAEIRRYLLTLRSADKTLDRVYDKTVEAYTKELNLKVATAVREEQKLFEVWRNGSDDGQGLLKDAVLVWTFDAAETRVDDGTTIVKDLSSRENHGRIFGHRTVPRSPGTAIGFDKPGASLVSDKDVGIVEKDPRTFAMWIYIGMPAQTRMDPMFGWGKSDQSQQFRWGYWNNRYRLWTYGDKTTRSLFEAVRGWHHVAMAYDGTTLRAYRNGSLTDAVSYELALNTMDSKLTLNENFLGAIDEVVILARCLSPIEVNELYQQSKRGLGPASRRSRIKAAGVAHRRSPWPRPPADDNAAE